MSNSPIRAVEFSADALTHNLKSLAATHGTDLPLDLRLDAYGHGRDWVTGIAEHLGFAHFLTDDESRASIAAETRGIFGIGAGMPVATAHAEIVAVKHIPAGDSVSYGYTWTAVRDSVIALASLGFADGLPRRGSNRVHGTISGISCPQVGRIAMDQVVFDATDAAPRIGETVTLWDSLSPLDEWASASGWEPLSLVTRLGVRVERRWRS
ncbi:MAG: hypothetical protein RL431_584 [Actinomycetota bacterium]